MDAPLLLVTATKLEAKLLHETLEWPQLMFPLGELYHAAPSSQGAGEDLYLAHLGVAKVNTAAGLALLIERLNPRAVIQFGIGGAYVGSFLSVGMLAVAELELHIDTGVRDSTGWQGMEALGFPLCGEHYNALPTSPELTKKIAEVTGAFPCIFGTSETVTGDFDDAAALQARFDLSIESMEGAAAAQVCNAFGVPFAELRAVSNIVGERDKAAWDIPSAVRSVNRAVLAYLRAAERVRPS